MMRALVAWAAALALLLPGFARGADAPALRIWWEQGASRAEDAALAALIARFEARARVKVELSLFGAQDLLQRLDRALQVGEPPDLAFGNQLDLQANALWAYEHRLEDLSDLIEPMRNRFDPVALSTTFLYDKVRQARGFHAFALRQQTVRIHYWKDMLAQAGYGERDIPRQWEGWWDFWCARVQPAYRAASGSGVYALGLPMGLDSGEAAQTFLAFLDAYGVQLVDAFGKLRFDPTAVRAGLLAALRSYTALYTQGCTPPSARNWGDADNDVAFLNRNVVVTPEAGGSLLARVLEDAQDPALPPERRAQAKADANGRIAVIGWPDKPDGARMPVRTAVKSGVVFQDARNKVRARQFVRFVLEDANLSAYVEASQGRWFPVMKAAQQAPFWQRDAFRQESYRLFGAGAVPYPFVTDPQFTQLMRENVWARAVHRVIDDRLPVEQAVDELIVRLRRAAEP